MSVMPTIENLGNLGRELRQTRLARGHKSLSSFARTMDVSPTYLSQLERGYVNPKQGLVVPSDEVLEKLAKGLDVPVSRLHGLLGRTPDMPFPAFEHPETVQLAEAYDQLPAYARKIVRDALKTAEEVVAIVDATQ